MQLVYIFWHWKDSFFWPYTRGKAEKEAAGYSHQQDVQDHSARSGLQDTVSVMKAAIQKLQEEVRALSERLDAKSC